MPKSLWIASMHRSFGEGDFCKLESSRRNSSGRAGEFLGLEMGEISGKC